tara:strand:+ start:436 stop:678 length:243 start_codon:yes stop_codon:yes gene_type:complete
VEAWVVQATKKEKHVGSGVAEAVVQEAVLALCQVLVLGAAAGVPELLAESRAAAKAERGAHTVIVKRIINNHILCIISFP